MTTISLDGPWQMRLAGKLKNNAPRDAGLHHWLPAVAPGTVHFHLQRAGKIPDPWYGRNEFDAQWVDQQDWEWRKTIIVAASAVKCNRQQLIFDGLDTVATIFLNGRKVGHSINMFRQVVCDVRGFLKPGRNVIRIYFASPTVFALAESKRGKDRVPPNEWRWQTGESRVSRRAWMRKVQCHFGWDWGVHLPTSGIWQSARLECADGPRLAAVTVEQHHHGPPAAPTSVDLQITCHLDAPAAVRGKLKISCDAKVREISLRAAEGESRVTASLTIDHPRLWWPAGQGPQNLYPLEVSFVNAAGVVEQTVRRRIGLCTLDLVTRRDRSPKGEAAESFAFHVNGRPVYAKGANWIPPDQFVDRCTPQVYRHLLVSMAQANHNIVRVWGGGWYEQDVFYDLCDELGIMVWHDFMMACALHPDTPRFLGELCAEARYQVRRLHAHPCIALWCGDNENAQYVWEWSKQWGTFTKNRAIYVKLLSALRKTCETEDRTRRFWLSSPSNNDYNGHPNDPNRGDVHYWTVWHGRQPFSNYLTVKPRFVSEFGFQSFPEPRTIRAVVPKDQMNPSSRVMEHHQRSGDGNLLITNTMAREMRIPKDFDSFCWVSQINQAMAIRTAVEHWRRLKPWCMGTIYWQVNDIWPVASWSSIDYYGRWKVLHHFSQRFYAPLLASMVVEGDKLAVWATSDVPQSLPLTGELEVFTWAGRPIARRPLRAQLRAGASRAIGHFSVAGLLDGQAQPHDVCVFARLRGGGHTSENFATLVPWKWVTLPKPHIRKSLRTADGTLELAVRSAQVIPFFHAEIQGTEGHFTGDWQVLRPNRDHRLRWVPHTDRGAAAPALPQARRRLATLSLADTY